VTKYIVLGAQRRGEAVAPVWVELPKVKAASARAAIRAAIRAAAAAVRETGDGEGPAAYVAVPVRSWQPLKATVDPNPRVKLEKAV
jgi:hypothetical protein